MSPGRFDVIGGDDGGDDDTLEAVKKVAGGTLTWVVIAFVVVAVFALSTFRMGRVSGEEVGILLNKLSGELTLVPESGVRFYNGITSDFYVLDKTIQTLDMTVKGASLKIKTKDGSDVYVELKVQYKIDASNAELVIRTSGPGEAFKKKWTRDYSRSVCRNFLGELTTEEFYDSSKRSARMVLAHRKISADLKKFGIIVDSVVMPQKPRFYEEYEAMIKKKKLADQGVLEEKSKALAATQLQHKKVVDATVEKTVTVTRFKGEMKKMLIVANAEGEKVRKAADAYYDKITIGAAAELYKRQKEADGILAKKKAEAEGIEALKKALEGEGGRNMVKLEYAKKLKDVKISGQPFTIQGHTERFEHLKAPASAGRK